MKIRTLQGEELDINDLAVNTPPATGSKNYNIEYANFFGRTQVVSEDMKKLLFSPIEETPAEIRNLLQAFGNFATTAAEEIVYGIPRTAAATEIAAGKLLAEQEKRFWREGVMPFGNYEDLKTGETLGEKFSQFSRNIYDGLASKLEQERRKRGYDEKAFSSALGQGMGSSIASLGTFLALSPTAGPAVASATVLGSFFAGSASEAYLNVEDKIDWSEGKKAAYSSVIGLAEAVPEVLGLNFLFKSITTIPVKGILSSAAKGLVLGAVEEGTEELITGVAQGTADIGFGLRDMKTEGFQALVTEPLFSATIGAITGGPMGAGLAVANRHKLSTRIFKNHKGDTITLSNDEKYTINTPEDAGNLSDALINLQMQDAFDIVKNVTKPEPLILNESPYVAAAEEFKYVENTDLNLPEYDTTIGQQWVDKTIARVEKQINRLEDTAMKAEEKQKLKDLRLYLNSLNEDIETLKAESDLILNKVNSDTLADEDPTGLNTPLDMADNLMKQYEEKVAELMSFANADLKDITFEKGSIPKVKASVVANTAKLLRNSYLKNLQTAFVKGKNAGENKYKIFVRTRNTVLKELRKNINNSKLPLALRKNLKAQSEKIAVLKSLKTKDDYIKAVAAFREGINTIVFNTKMETLLDGLNNLKEQLKAAGTSKGIATVDQETNQFIHNIYKDVNSQGQDYAGYISEKNKMYQEGKQIRVSDMYKMLLAEALFVEQEFKLDKEMLDKDTTVVKSFRAKIEKHFNITKKESTVLISMLSSIANSKRLTLDELLNKTIADIVKGGDVELAQLMLHTNPLESFKYVTKPIPRKSKDSNKQAKLDAKYEQEVIAYNKEVAEVNTWIKDNFKIVKAKDLPFFSETDIANLKNPDADIYVFKESIKPTTPEDIARTKILIDKLVKAAEDDKTLSVDLEEFLPTGHILRALLANNKIQETRIPILVNSASTLDKFIMAQFLRQSPKIEFNPRLGHKWGDYEVFYDTLEHEVQHLLQYNYQLYGYGGRGLWFDGYVNERMNAEDLSGLVGKELSDAVKNYKRKSEEKIAYGTKILAKDTSWLAQDKRGGVSFTDAGKGIIHAFEQADFSTFVHEFAHIARRTLLTEQESNILNQWVGAGDNIAWTVEQEEKWAVGFEKYLLEGKAPESSLQKMFNKIKMFMQDVYKRLSSAPDVEITPEVKSVLDGLFKHSAEALFVEQEFKLDKEMLDKDTAITTLQVALNEFQSLLDKGYKNKELESEARNKTLEQFFKVINDRLDATEDKRNGGFSSTILNTFLNNAKTHETVGTRLILFSTLMQSLVGTRESLGLTGNASEYIDIYKASRVKENFIIGFEKRLDDLVSSLFGVKNDKNSVHRFIRDNLREPGAGQIRKVDGTVEEVSIMEMLYLLEMSKDKTISDRVTENNGYLPGELTEENISRQLEQAALDLNMPNTDALETLGQFLLKEMRDMKPYISKVYSQTMDRAFYGVENYFPLMLKDSAQNDSFEDYISQVGANLLDPTIDVTLPTGEPIATGPEQTLSNRYLLSRTWSNKKYAILDLFDAASAYKRQMVHYVAFAKPVFFLNQMIKNPEIMDKLNARLGPKLVNMFKDYLTVFAKQSLDGRRYQKDNFLKMTRGSVAVILSAGKQFIQQWSSLINVAAQVKPVDFLKYTAQYYAAAAGQGTALDREIRNAIINSDFLTNRQRNLHMNEEYRMIKEMQERGERYGKKRKLLNDPAWVDITSFFMKKGDTMSVVNGAFALTKKYIEQDNLTPAVAIDKALREVRELNQSADPDQVLPDATSSNIGSTLIFMFTNQSTQLYNKSLQTILSYRRGEISRLDAAHRIATYLLVSSVLYWILSRGKMPESPEEWLEASLNTIVGLPYLNLIIGGLSAYSGKGGSTVLGMTASNAFMLVKDVQQTVDAVVYSRGTDYSNQLILQNAMEALQDAAVVGGAVTPAMGSVRLLADTGEALSELLGYSSDAVKTKKAVMAALGYSKYARDLQRD